MKTLKIISMLALFFTFSVFPQTLIKSKVGILVSSEVAKSKKSTLTKLKSNAEVKLGDQYRILLQPESTGNGYFILLSNGMAQLLQYSEASKNQILAYPVKTDFVKFDKKGSYEIIILFSGSKISSLDNLFKKNKSIKLADFTKTFDALKKKVKQKVSDDSQEEIIIAGNVRGTQSDDDKAFLKKIKPFGTKDILILQYNVKVK